MLYIASMRYSIAAIPDGGEAMRGEDHNRLLQLESEVRRLSRRVERLEGLPEAWNPAPTAVVPARRKARPVRPPRASFEELVGGRLLALTGGVAVLLGVAFLVALAVDRGWIGEGARLALAFGGSLALLAAGAWLYEARGRTQAALAAVGTAVAALYLTLAAATSLYELVPVAPALLLALAVGALATVLAVRWDSRTVAGVGILGALASPALLGQVGAARGVAFVAVALAAAAGVLLWRRWEWLRIAAFAVAMPQVAV
jgi:uncharacterized membrane protein